MPNPIPNPVQEAAAAVVALINGSPRSPRQEEIEAIIAKAVLSHHQEPAPDPRLMEWREKVAACRAAVDAAATEEDDAVVDAALNALDAYSHAIWATPVRTFADLLLRAAIAQEWNTPSSEGDPSYPAWALQKEKPGMDDLALAHVVQAVLEMGGQLP